MAANAVFGTIERHNAGRDPERLAMKYDAMYGDPFSFFRGTCHLFYARIPRAAVLRDCPTGWLCGDLHLENLGSFKADNRLAYFDLNDFDEAILGPATWDLWRLLASVRVGAGSIGIKKAAAAALCADIVDAFGEAMREGKARWVERATAQGMVRDLLAGLKNRNRSAFIAARTQTRKGVRQLRIDGKHTLAATPSQRAAVERVIRSLAKSQPNPKFYKVVDVARRIAGTGSLGVPRYAILIEGRGSPDGNFLLDLKHSLPSSLAGVVATPQPNWANDATRVITVQQWVQAASPALLGALELDGKSFLIRELQPTADRVDLDLAHGALQRLRGVVETMARLAAWGLLRAAGRHGASGPDDLIAYFSGHHWQKPLLEQAAASAEQSHRQWADFRRGIDARAAKKKR